MLIRSIPFGLGYFCLFCVLGSSRVYRFAIIETKVNDYDARLILFRCSRCRCINNYDRVERYSLSRNATLLPERTGQDLINWNAPNDPFHLGQGGGTVGLIGTGTYDTGFPLASVARMVEVQPVIISINHSKLCMKETHPVGSGAHVCAPAC